MITNLIDSFVDRGRFTILMLVFICLWGFLAYRTIPKENTPDVKIPIIYVNVVLEGIAPEDAERLLLKPLENGMRSIDGVKEMTSYANEGNAVIFLEFYPGFDSKKALNDVRAKVQDNEKDLPEEARRPSVHEVNLSLFPVLTVVLTGDLPMNSLVAIARNLKTKVEQVDGVLEVKIAGDMEDALEIVVKPEVLTTYGLSLDNLAALISSNNKLIAAGSLRSRSGEFSIKVPSLIETHEQLMNFPIKVKDGSSVKLGDIAEVRRTYKDPLGVANVNERPAVALDISKRTGTNIIDVVSKIKQVIDVQKEHMPQNLDLIYVADESSQIIDMVQDLESNIILGIMLVTLVVIASVGMRSALLISLSIPSSFLAGILFLSLCGYTLNVVVLFSLILTVGMIVDDAIVVSEYADRMMKEGVPLKDSFIVSAKRMLWPIVTSTLVKIVVFLPLLFWPGVIGQFMKYMPITVIAILTNSLIFALFFQPTLGPLFGKSKHIQENKDWDVHSVDKVDLDKLDKFTNFYYSLLRKVLEKPKKFVYSILGVLVGVYTFFIAFGTGLEFFPEIEPDFVHISVISPGNLSLNEREDIMHKVDAEVMKFKDDLKIVYSRAGNFDAQTDLPEDTIGTVFIEYKQWDMRRKSKYVIADLRNALSQFHGLKIEVSEKKPGPPPEKPIQLNVSAYDFAKANEVADKIKEFMETTPGYIQVEDSRAASSMEWHVVADRAKAAQYAIDLPNLGNSVRLVTNGMVVTTYRPDDAEDEVDVLLRLPEEYRTVEHLKNMKLVNALGASIPLSNFAQVLPHTKLKKIKKVNREKVISIKSDVAEGYLNDTMVKTIEEFVKKEKLEMSANIVFKGEKEKQDETGSFLRNAFIMTLALMFMIMLIQFNNYYHTFIIMSAVFLSTVGVLLGLIFTWQPFGIVMCGVGIIALGGIVLNNNILFIDTYQHLRKDGIGIDEAIVRAGVQRLRPILLTATTAVLGLLPLVFGLTIDILHRHVAYDAPSSQWWRQLAASIAGGLTFATILTLFFTPCLLKLGRRFD